MHGLRTLTLTIGFWLFGVQLHGVQAQAAVPRLGALQVLSAVHAPPKIEIALLTPPRLGSTVHLASKAAHARQGYDYPLWLSDAQWAIKSRPGQRLAVQIESQRTPEHSSHEIVMEFRQPDGTRQLQTYTLLLAVPREFAGAALPNTLQESDSYDFSIAAPTAPEAMSTPTAASTLAPNFAVKTQPAKAMPNSPRKPRAALADLPRPVVDTAPVAITPDAPATATSEPIAPPAALPAAPPATPQALPSPQPRPSHSLYFDELTWLIIGAVALLGLLVLFLIVRMWRHLQANKARNAPVLTQETQFGRSPQDNGANTVFGLSDNEAIAVQQQWLQKK